MERTPLAEKPDTPVDLKGFYHGARYRKVFCGDEVRKTGDPAKRKTSERETTLKNTVIGDGVEWGSCE